MKRLDLTKLEKVERDEEKYRKSQDYYNRYGLDMFRLDLLFASGTMYGLPHIPYAGTLSEGTYLTYNEDKGAITIYHMNGYVQPVFSMNMDGMIINRQNPSVPYAYTETIADYIKDNLIAEIQEK